MEELIDQFRRRIAGVSLQFVRSLTDKVSWESRLVGIRGARGTGKTTLILQHIKKQYGDNLNRILYVSLDNLWFSRNTLPDLAGRFVREGGTHLFLDEVHRYPEWPRVIKNLYDDYPGLSLVFTGSSLLTILDARADLSRRAVVYTLQGLSFREYLNLIAGTRFRPYSLDDMLRNHEGISAEVCARIKPFEFFAPYLKAGYYPYFMEGKETYQIRLEETVSMILDLELPLLRQVQAAYVPKLKQLLSIISESAPFIPNISRLSERIGINRQTLLAYIKYLGESRLVRSLYRQSRGTGALQKPDKIFLENTNLMYLFKGDLWDRGNVRETFLMNQLAYEHRLEFPESGDFLADGRYLIEAGGRRKNRKQIAGVPEAYIAADDIEYGHGDKIPLWLFGFLY
jgi:predicted AAA+ superfamily ATPase